MTTLPIVLPPEEEVRFQEWANQHGEAMRREAQAIFSNQKPLQTLLNLFAKAVSLLQPVAREVTHHRLEPSQFILILLQTMVALSRINEGRPYTSDELFSRSPLEGAMVLYDLQIVPLEIAAHIAGVSQREFLDELGKAGIPVLQYSLNEVLADVEAA